MMVEYFGEKLEAIYLLKMAGSSLIWNSIYCKTTTIIWGGIYEMDH